MIPGFPLVNHVAFHNTFHLPPYYKLFYPSKSVFTAYMLRSTNWPSAAPATFSPFPSTSTDACYFPWHLHPCKRQAKKMYFFPQILNSMYSPLTSLSLLWIMTSLTCLFEGLNLLYILLLSVTSLSLGHSWPGLHGQVDTRDKFFTFFRTPGAFGWMSSWFAASLPNTQTETLQLTSQCPQRLPSPAHCA